MELNAFLYWTRNYKPSTFHQSVQNSNYITFADFIYWLFFHNGIVFTSSYFSHGSFGDIKGSQCWDEVASFLLYFLTLFILVLVGKRELL